ncbi:MAG: hypothetical protein IJ397_07060 [Lachnospiraceae bacterium]|nr:hypothetical protein [Lachnospiraceae bacterium]
MAEKKTATAKPVAKAVAAKVEEKKVEATPVKAEAPAKKEAAKKAAPAKKEAVKKAAPAKKEVAKKEAPAKKEVAKKAAPAKKEAPAKKAAAKKEAIYVQFAGKSYSNDELLKIAKDVWVYDMGQKAADMKSVEIYVKPEESMAYFVVNGTENGSFMI